MRLIFTLALVLAASLFVVAGSSDRALAAKRVALVIGNSAYKFAGELPNPKNDASDMSAVFKRLGFQVVEGIDLDKAAFDRKIRDFAAALQGAELGVFFYAGHGLQVGGQNYLVPTDAELSSQDGLDFEMVRLDLVHRTMERATDTNVIFLDACRNNPLERNLRRAMGTRSADIGKGLAPVQSGTGTLISFSTQPGNVAADGTGRNSPFAAALVRHLSSSNDDLSAILISVRNDVMKETQRSQVPWEHSALTGRLYFGAAAQTASNDRPGKSPDVSQSEAERAWALTKDATNIAMLEAFVARFKDTFYAYLAKVRIEELKRQQTAAVSPKPIPPDIPAAKGAPIPDGSQSAWVKLCENATGGDPPKPVNICLTHHERLDGNTGMVLVSAAVRQIEGRADQHLMVMVPLGMQQGPGMRAYIYPKDKWAAVQKNEKVDENGIRMIQLPYSLCHAAGCTGEVEAKPDLIADLKKGGGIILYAINNAGSPVGFPIPLAGFEQAYVGAPIDNKKYAEARKKLMEQIAARQAELAKEQAKQKK
jgi:invasion protein IalB